MRIIFLDISGVLATGSAREKEFLRTGKPHSGSNSAFDPVCLLNLLHIVEKTNSKIVIASSWIKSRDTLMALYEVFRTWGLLDAVIGCTPMLNEKRGLEIRVWLYEHPGQCTNYVIIDDDYDSSMEDMIDHLVKPKFNTGLTIELADEAIRKLTR